MDQHRLHNFRYALRGIGIAWREEFNFRVQVVLSAIALLAGWYLRITAFEWRAILLLIALVLTAELFNTALEELCDKFSAEHDPRIGKIKDLAAGAVLVASAAALVIGCIIFIPYIAALV